MRKRHILTYSVVAILCFYVGFIFYSRSRDNRALMQRLEERRQGQQAQVPEAYRGTELKIVAFYPYPAAINKGQKAKLCYGVVNSEKIRIEPPVENVWPSLSRCVEVMPKSTTVYKLIAEDEKGNTKKAEATVQVF
jgi:hypothetical protein